jgi:cell division protein FtsB
MNKSLALKNKLYLFFLLLITFFIFIYLFYFLINGERGVISFYKIKNQNSEYQNTISNLERQNLILTDRIKRLQINTLDLDFLEEKIREKTGYLTDKEILIVFD